MRDLTPFFRPRSVAVVGAGERPTSSGGAVLRNMQIANYDGEIVPVNPKGGEILGLAAKRSLRELDSPADLAVVIVRPDFIPDVVRDAAASGHKNLLILPGGFSEAGEEGAAREAEVSRIAADAGITIAGPNCAGLISNTGDAQFAATFLRDLVPGGGLAFVSQSGALAEEVVARSHDMPLPLGTVVSVGNALHLGIEDYLHHLGNDDAVSAVLLYLESTGNLDRLRHVAREVALKKPVVAMIPGRTAPGQRAAKAHTGGHFDDDAAVDRFCAEAGILRVDSLRRLLLAAKGFGAFPKGLGKRALVLSNSGGPGVIASDRATLEGLELSPLPDAMAATLRGALPGEASVANPIDLLADAREDRFEMALDSALANAAGHFDSILMIHVVPFMVEAGPVIERLAGIAAKADLPIMHSMMGTLVDKRQWFSTMESAGVPMFDNVEEMAETAGILARYGVLREELVRWT